MKKLSKAILILICQLGIVSCNIGSNSESNDWSTSGKWVQLNSSGSGYADDNGSVYDLGYSNNHIYLVNYMHNIWQYDLSNNLWKQYQYNTSKNQANIIPMLDNSNIKKTTDLATYLTHNLAGDLFVGLDTGDISFLSNGVWHDISMAENVAITNMQVISSHNNIYVGNEAGNVWYYDSQNGGNWGNISDTADYTANGAITQIIVDDKTTPSYLGVANEGGDLFVYSIPNQRWLNVTKEPIVRALYHDNGSPITTLQIYFLDNKYVYGYVGNQKGNVWRIILNRNRYQDSRIDNITKDINFQGYNDIGSPITAMVVDEENNLYIGNEAGHVWFINFSKHKWVNLTKTSKFDGGESQITSLILDPQQKNSIFVANEDGYVGYYQMLD